MKTVFVILHYCLPEVTKDCVQSLLSLDGDKEIVIVDNASPDGSGTLLKALYSNEDRVNVLLNRINGGFADGNNIGYLFAKKHFHPDCIVVLNNDTLIKDVDFINKIFADEMNSQYHIVAPDVLTIQGVHQNPYREMCMDSKLVRKKYKKEKIKSLLYSVPLLYRLKPVKSVCLDPNERWMERRENIVPHGSAIIFMSKWIQNEDFAFYPGTFMYFEEDLLYYYAKEKKYKILYEPSLQVCHLEDMSTNYTCKKTRSKMLFQAIHKAKSLKLLYDLCK